MKKPTKAARAQVFENLLQMGLITNPEEYMATLIGEAYTIKKWVRDTKLARKMYPDVLKEEDGKIYVDTGIEAELMILGLEEGFTYCGTPKK